MIISVMKNIETILLLTTCLAMSSISSAQSLSVADEYKLNQDALQTIEQYEMCASLYDKSASVDFMLLFDDPNLPIFNDLMGLYAGKEITVKDYVDVLSSKAQATSIVIKNIKKGKPFYQDGEWLINITFDKEMTYANKCDILFSSKDYYEADYHYFATLAWVEDERRCSIRSLKGQNGSNKSFPDSYSILLHTEDRDNQITYIDGGKSKNVVFNRFDQALLPYHPSFQYPDYDITVKVIEENPECNLISLRYKPRHWRIKLHYDYSVNDFYNVDFGTDLMSKKMSSNEFGCDFGYILPTNGALKLGLFSGLGLAQNSIDLSQDNMAFNYDDSGSGDIDGDAYVRYYSLSQIKNNVKIVDAYVPFYLDFDYRCAEQYSIYVDLGAKVFLNLKNEASDYSANYSVFGHYKQYDDLFLYESSGINGFKDRNSGVLTSSNVANPEFPIKKISFDAFGALGVRVKLAPWLLLDLSVVYQKSMASLLQETSSIKYQKGTTTSMDSPVTYDANTGLESVKSCSDYLIDLNRSQLKISSGLVIKF